MINEISNKGCSYLYYDPTFSRIRNTERRCYQNIDMYLELNYKPSLAFNYLVVIVLKLSCIMFYILIFIVQIQNIKFFENVLSFAFFIIFFMKFLQIHTMNKSVQEMKCCLRWVFVLSLISIQINILFFVLFKKRIKKYQLKLKQYFEIIISQL